MKFRGFTLIEVVIVIIILSIIAAIGSRVLQTALNAYITSQNIVTANAEGRLAFERMTRDIHSVPSAASITTASSSQFAFTNASSSSVSYQLTGTQLMRSGQVLADGINTLTFAYLDQNAVATTTAANICYVTFTLNITSGGVNYTLRSTVSTMNYC